MHQVLFYIGDFPVRSFGVMLSLGILAGLLVSYYVAKGQGRFQEEVLDLAFYAILGGLIGARIWEVMFSWDYYGSHLWQIPAIWNGGISVQGSVLGGLLAVIWYCRKNKTDIWPMLDTLAPGVLVGQAIGRLGCFLNGCCYGIPHQHLGVVYPAGTDAYYAFGAQPLFPAVLFEAAWDVLVLFLLLFIYKRKPFDGFIALSYFLFYSVGRFVLEFWRGDSLRTFMNFKAAQVSSAATVIIALALMFYLSNRQRRTVQKNRQKLNIKD
ncbi:prolipoprotein diacylglyceryl transferase [Desulforamulus hydrothermalis]|uniref:Phosphatidylglycerol--prolipoprotein diacylglyceryl transferase n=1 Tax=Desulforamulus hydrothermalis Lam5 = DSM 18033 TaxID=1121428 RepID=K8E032_9FIRM|nr:prolipoprotein diacylglyceryl transferase [Desulforamulus hydrothermalis]CCO08824.1 Prolipoprotein diacylglyceryl transferase 1 [Desulforamulus hydrothermalis Lam5 = DSM 18033]SHG72481.1 phosphatidylglycerol:prolipoprotein diacylglycerol transferase [Desulforamulus hydrothermalis Lam5 = DSM 18033]